MITPEGSRPGQPADQHKRQRPNHPDERSRLVRDVTTVEQAHPDRQLVLLAKGGLLGAARITIDINPDGSGSTLTLTETPVSGPGKWVNNPLTEAITHRRNTETLTRLTALVERRTQPDT
jgi:hypothetical protein